MSLSLNHSKTIKAESNSYWLTGVEINFTFSTTIDTDVRKRENITPKNKNYKIMFCSNTEHTIEFNIIFLCIFRRLLSLNNKHTNNITWLQNQIKKRIIGYSPTRVLYTPGYFYEICVVRIFIFYVVFCRVLYFFFGLFPLLISLSVLFRLTASDYTTFVCLKLLVTQQR